MGALDEIRYKEVINLIVSNGIKSVLDFGCGGGAFEKQVCDLGIDLHIHGIDLSPKAIHRANNRNLPFKFERASIFDFKPKYKEFDCIVLIETIEHLNECNLPTLIHNVFRKIAPRFVIVSTPNKDYNCNFNRLVNGLRNSGHKFEFTEAEFATWCKEICDTYQYECTIIGLGQDDLGSMSQMSLFEKIAFEKPNKSNSEEKERKKL